MYEVEVICYHLPMLEPGEQPDENDLSRMAQRCHLEYVQITEEGVYVLNCPICGPVVCKLQFEKFEILFEMAIHSFVLGDFGSSVLKSSTMLERLFQFEVFCVAFHLGLSSSQVDKLWKSIGAQSERQLGAFFLSAALLSREFEGLDILISKSKLDKLSLTRNKVVHAGYIPDRDEAARHLKQIYEAAVKILKSLNTAIPEALQKTVSHSNSKVFDSAQRRLAEIYSGHGYVMQSSISLGLLSDVFTNRVCSFEEKLDSPSRLFRRRNYLDHPFLRENSSK